VDPAVRRRRVVVVIASIAALPVLAVLVFFFVPATSFSPAALGYAVAEETSGNGILESIPCERRGRGGWSCWVWNQGGSGTVRYQVDMEGSRCWHGVRISTGYDGDGNPLPRGVSGCLKVEHQLRLWDRVL
jgi:hypothetical protein